MDVTTTLLQKLGRMMLRLHEAPATTYPLLRPGGRLSLVANLFASCRPIFWQRVRWRERSSYSCRPEGRCLGCQGSISPMDPQRADPSSTISIQSRAAIIEQAIFMPEAFFSWSSERGRPHRAVSWSHGIEPAKHHHRATGLSYHLDEGAEIQLRHGMAFGPDHVMRKRISCHRCGRRHQVGIRLL
ncbi:hypothetical protein ACVWZL_008862 [Bradyrhizobium sp. GM2.4]